jgi:hypothetical protein
LADSNGSISNRICLGLTCLKWRADGELSAFDFRLGGCCTNNPCTSAMNALPWLGLAAIPPSALFVRRLHLFGAPGATGGLGGLYVTAQLNLNNLSRLWPVLISDHSPFTFSSPLSKKRRRPRFSGRVPWSGVTQEEQPRRSRG